MIKATDVKKAYAGLEVLKGVSLEVDKGEVVAIVGPSGAGKTTLLSILGTLDVPDSGEVWLAGQSLTGLKGNRLAAFRNANIGFVFQFHHLLAEFTALENVCIPALIGGMAKHDAEKRALVLLERLGVGSRAGHKPGQMSGGEQQRTAVARALMNEPSVVFADEPSGNLDSANASELHKLFFELRKEMGQTFVIVTHNEHLAQMADRQIVMRDGRMV